MSTMRDLPAPSYNDPEKLRASASKLLSFVETRAPYLHPWWIRLQEVWERADCYYSCVQWLVKSYNSAPNVTTHWSRLELDPDDPDYVPTPVYDEFSPPIENEAARLGRPDYQPYVRPEGEDPSLEVRTAAKLAETVLQSELRRMRWTEQEELGNLHSPLYGGWFLYSCWDTSWEETVTVGSPAAVRCEACGFMTPDPAMPMSVGSKAWAEEDAQSLDRQIIDDGAGGSVAQYRLNRCPVCDPDEMVPNPALGLYDPQPDPITGMPTVEPPPEMLPRGPQPLKRFVPVGGELHQRDPWGRQLGMDVPLGQWKLQTLHPTQVFIENLGIGVSPSTAAEFMVVHVESLEWCRNRYNGCDDLLPENPFELMKFHPVAGERAVYFGYDVNRRIFDNHVRVWEYHHKPFRVNGSMNRGRSIVRVGDRIVFDGDYMIESRTTPGKLIPRCHLDYAPWKIRRGGQVYHGSSLSEQLFDSQDNVNEMRSQIQNARQAMGSPKWLIPRGAQFDYEQAGSAGSHWLFDPDPANPASVPREIGNTLLNPAVYQEMSSDLDYIGRTSGQREVDTGGVPSGVTAALAIQYLTEQSGERRKPRIRRIREMRMRCWSHGLLLLHEMVREPRKLWVRDQGGKWSQQSWRGLDLMGQTDVLIDPQPDKDSPIVKSQGTADAINAGLFDTQNPRVKRILARELGIASDAFDQDDMQEDQAEREFSEFMSKGRTPFVDMDIDDHEAHFSRHGQDMMSDKWRDLEDSAGWDAVLPYLYGWEQVLNSTSLVADPVTGQQMAVPAGMNVEMDQAGVPKCPEIRIAACWQRILSDRGFQVTGDLARVIRFRAHNAAHKQIGQAKAQQAAAGQMQMAAPQGATGQPDGGGEVAA